MWGCGGVGVWGCGGVGVWGCGGVGVWGCGGVGVWGYLTQLNAPEPIKEGIAEERSAYLG